VLANAAQRANSDLIDAVRKLAASCNIFNSVAPV
jgi:hypothetical protein